MKHFLILIALCLSLTGCFKTAPDNKTEIKQALSEKYGEDLCLRYSMTYPFELYVIKKQKARLDRADVLVAAGLLEFEEERKFVERVGYVPVRTYSLTEKGAQAINQNFELCYARRDVSDVLSIKEIDLKTFHVVFEISDTYTDRWAEHQYFAPLTKIEPTKTMQATVRKTIQGQFIAQ